MSYTPPVGLVNASLTGAYTPPVGVVNASLCGGGATSVSVSGELSAALASLLGTATNAVSVSVSALLSTTATLSGTRTLSVARPGTLAASTAQVLGTPHVPVLIRAFGEIVGSFHISVSSVPALLSQFASLSASSQISVQVGDQLLTQADLSGGWCQEAIITAPVFTASGELIGDSQISCLVAGTVSGATLLSARFAEGRIISNALLDGLAALDAGFYTSVNLNGLVLDSGAVLSGIPIINVQIPSSAFQAVGAIMGTRVVVAPTILSGQHPSVESATTAYSLLTLHDGSTWTWH